MLSQARGRSTCRRDDRSAPVLLLKQMICSQLKMQVLLKLTCVMSYTTIAAAAPR